MLGVSCCLAAAAAAALGLAGAHGPADWPQMGRTASFASFKNSTGVPAPHKEWMFGPKGRFIASPAVFDGTVYVGSGDGHLYALDQRSGELKWAFPQSCMPAHSAACGENGIRSSPAVDPADGSIAFGSYDGHVYKVDRAGRLLWSFETGGPIYSPASIDADGAVYVGTRHPDNCMYVLHGATRTSAADQLKWKACGAPTGLDGFDMDSAAAVGEPDGPGQDIVVMNNFDGAAKAFDRATGRALWVHNHSAHGGAAAAIAGGVVFAGSWDRHLYALELRTGRQIWAFDTGGEIESHPAYAAGAVFVSAEESFSLFALNASTAELLWTFNDTDGAEINGSPTVTRDRVYIGTNDGSLYALHRGTGAVAAKMATGCGTEGHVFSSAAVADNGMVYFTCNSPGRRRRRLGPGGHFEPATATDPGLSDPPGLGMAYAVNPRKHGVFP